MSSACVYAYDNRVWQQFDCQYATLEGFSTGVLTQTTPTLTPTTLRSIEQTFIELQTVPPPHQIPHHNEAGFVPPVVNSHLVRGISPPSVVVVGGGGGGMTRSQQQQPPSNSNGTSYQKMVLKDPHGNSSSSNVGSSSNSSTSSSGWTNGRGTATTRGGPKGGRNMGGRRPAKYEKLTPEEEERRRVRRERNKLAAARCRKRRMDHTNSLVYETEGLEEHRSSLQSEIQELQNQKDELEFILEAHKVVCKLHKHSHNNNNNNNDDGGGGMGRISDGGHDHDHHVDIKPDLTELQMAIASANTISTPTSSSSSSGVARYMGTVVTTASSSKPMQRPNSLALSSTFAVPHPPSVVTSSSKLSLTEATGIAISTPSSGIFNFEALMEGGTGLTPVSSGTGFTLVVPTCSTQLRSSGGDLSSPDTITPPKLVSL